MSLTAGFAEGEHGVIWTTAAVIGGWARAMGMGAIPASTAWPVANTAILVPFLVAGPTTVSKLFFQAGTTPGTTNYDLGIYDETFNRLASLGATAAVSTTDAVLPAGGGALAAPLGLQRGRYYLAMSSASASLTVRAIAATNGTARAWGLQQMATAHPLPTTITPASMGTTTFVPTLGLMLSSAPLLL